MNVEIESIFKADSKLCIKPVQGDYEMIYRAAMGVNWDVSMKCLVYTGIDTEDNKKIDIIKRAVFNEYGVNLLVTDNTKIELEN